ncbi:Nitrile-specifier protein 5 [Thelohanellus kitauei]|uniref:Nitrile-specifier protein 5 n=1 Tax=Thelohanellus kitauei TaxID=669202 RepID=A0A0C2MQE9_THEKT|nr:Nitrile-specifier protein 5 [Thelohanellus kitauei]
MNVTSIKSAPKSRCSHSMTSVNNSIIIYGGFDIFSLTIYNELWIYNTITDMWQLYPGPFQTENRLVSSAICAVGNLVYVFGGKNPNLRSQETNFLLVFDISTGTWKTLSSHTNEYDQNSPPPMYDSCIFYHNESLYILGGYTDYQFLDNMFQFSLKTSRWTLVPQNGPKLRSTKRIFATIFKNNRLMGSVHRIENFSRSYFRVNLAISAESLKSGIVFHNMALIDDSILYVYGGGCSIPICSNKLERFAVQPSSLDRLCLESIKRLPNVRSIAALLPASIADELNINRDD